MDAVDEKIDGDREQIITGPKCLLCRFFCCGSRGGRNFLCKNIRFLCGAYRQERMGRCLEKYSFRVSTGKPRFDL